jgi:hypothetical protein
MEDARFGVKRAACAHDGEAGYALGADNDVVIGSPTAAADLDDVMSGYEGKNVVDHEADVLGQIQKV